MFPGERMSDILYQNIESSLLLMNIEPDADKIKRLADYIELLEKWAKHINLVSATGYELIVRHIYDSLAGFEYFKGFTPMSVFDIGSGAGLPGIPLAIFMDSTSFLLVEPRQKRAAFLETVVSELGLKNCSIANMRVEELGEKAELVTARAFSSLSGKNVGLICSPVSKGGTLILYKGRHDKAVKESVYLRDKFASVSVRPLAVPHLNEERHLIIAEKFKL